MRVNGGRTDPADSRLDPDTRLLDYLRDVLGLRGTKEACGRGECGACTVLIDGRPHLSCITLASRVDGDVETVEGVSREAAALRRAFAEQGAFQCGFCTPGQVVRGTALLREGLPPDDAGLRTAISGNVCRCTGYAGIVAALRSAERQASSDTGEMADDGDS
ncbi:MAG: (2Fe-2S)-binding protein [Actinomycetota bacterium]|nr:(2Fe-2S)-binding protein [Actinomycetota bacterium]